MIAVTSSASECWDEACATGLLRPIICRICFSGARRIVVIGLERDHSGNCTGRYFRIMRNIVAKWSVVSGIAVIAFAMLVGPLFSPNEFSWLRHSTSEQAGQNIPGAWIMRTGFVAYGTGVVVAAALDWHRRTWVRAATVAFGLGLIGTAIWSNAPIVAEMPADMREDWFHSVASGVVGTAFALACAAWLFAPDGDRRDVLAWCGLVIAVLVPILMNAVPDLRGLFQRAMFVFSFVFMLREFPGPYR